MPIEIFENTLLKFLQRQGSDADRKNIILDSGELGYVVDTNRLFAGDGSTAGGNVVGNKYVGESATITNLSPCEIGDIGYETSTDSLFVVKVNNGYNVSDWKLIARLVKVTEDSPITVTDNALNLNVEAPLFIESNTLKLSLSGDDAPLTSSDIVNLIYPINSVFFTLADINPSSYFVDTTWVQVSQGRFLAGVGTGTDLNSSTKTLTAGDNTGEYSHTLTEAELPSHTHEGYNVSAGAGGDDLSDSVNWNDNIVGNGLLIHENKGHTSRLVVSPVSQRRSLDGQPMLNEVGDDSPHNNTPPSYGLYVWRRLT